MCSSISSYNGISWTLSVRMLPSLGSILLPLKISKIEVHKNKVQQQTLWATKLEAGRRRKKNNNSQLTGMTVNSTEYYSATI